MPYNQDAVPVPLPMTWLSIPLHLPPYNICSLLSGDSSLVLSGSVNIVVNYYWGSSNIFGHIGQGEIFAETYATIPNKEMPIKSKLYLWKGTD